MTTEEDLLAKWHSLSKEKQKQVLDFMDFLYWQDAPSPNVLEERLQQIRNKIKNYGKSSYNNPPRDNSK